MPATPIAHQQLRSAHRRTVGSARGKHGWWGMKQQGNSNTGATGISGEGSGRRAGAALPVAVVLSCVLMLFGLPAFAQTSVDNIARVGNPTGLSCSDVATNPTCERSDNALIT